MSSRSTQAVSESHEPFRSVSSIEWVVLLAIIGLGLISRIYLESAWNFKPVAALTLFGGFFFRHWLISAAAMLTIMFLSDTQLGLYDYRIMASTYGALVLTAWLGSRIRRAHGPVLNGWRPFFSFAGAALVMSLLFHVLTNTAVWWIWYPRSWQGLVDCFVAAMPFFRSTLQSNLLFTGLIVGGYVLVAKVVSLRSGVQVAELQ